MAEPLEINISKSFVEYGGKQWATYESGGGEHAGGVIQGAVPVGAATGKGLAQAQLRVQRAGVRSPDHGADFRRRQARSHQYPGSGQRPGRC